MKRVSTCTAPPLDLRPILRQFTVDVCAANSCGRRGGGGGAAAGVARRQGLCTKRHHSQRFCPCPHDIETDASFCVYKEASGCRSPPRERPTLLRVQGGTLLSLSPP